MAKLNIVTPKINISGPGIILFLYRQITLELGLNHNTNWLIRLNERESQESVHLYASKIILRGLQKYNGRIKAVEKADFF